MKSKGTVADLDTRFKGFVEVGLGIGCDGLFGEQGKVQLLN